LRVLPTAAAQAAPSEPAPAICPAFIARYNGRSARSGARADPSKGCRADLAGDRRGGRPPLPCKLRQLTRTLGEGRRGKNTTGFQEGDNFCCPGSSEVSFPVLPAERCESREP
jgi:hypothetical protein